MLLANPPSNNSNAPLTIKGTYHFLGETVYCSPIGCVCVVCVSLIMRDRFCVVKKKRCVLYTKPPSPQSIITLARARETQKGSHCTFLCVCCFSQSPSAIPPPNVWLLHLGCCYPVNVSCLWLCVCVCVATGRENRMCGVRTKQPITNRITKNKTKNKPIFQLLPALAKLRSSIDVFEHAAGHREFSSASTHTYTHTHTHTS